MPIAITDDHRRLGEVVGAFLADRGALAESRRLIEEDDEQLPSFWKEFAELGWLGLHLPEAVGGSGYTLAELAIVLEQLGRVVAPGPIVATTWSSAVMARSKATEDMRDVLRSLAEGTAVGAVALGGGVSIEKGHAVGDAGVVLGAGLATVLLVAAGDDMAVIAAPAEDVIVTPHKNLDPTRRAASVSLAGAPVAAILPGARATAVAIGRALAAAEASGSGAACVEMATDYAKVRKQFNRVIGTFQAVKHHAANMLVASELAAAATWDAARADQLGPEFELAAAVASAQAIPAFLFCAQLNIQIHGGIGYTWEHNAHLYLRRAGALAALFGPLSSLRQDVTRLVVAGVRRNPSVNLPAEAEPLRAEVRTFLDGLKTMPDRARLAGMLDNRYVNPHWPRPWGRSAGAIEQLVIDEEFSAAGVERPDYGIGAWIIQTLIQHATPDQIERWIRPSLEGTYRWCQLFSEPDAGSDAAGIRTKGTRVDGGWIVNGQKIWTSGAQLCNRGWATVRTDIEAPKHAGITMMVIDMESPEVEIRPLREASGGEAFNEVFFNDYFVPDDDVVGEVNGGWRAARSTLGNERVNIGGGMATGGPGVDLIALARQHPDDTAVQQQIGALLAEGEAMAMLTLRTVERAVARGEPGPEGNVAKLLNGEHAQRAADFGLAIAGPEGAFVDDGFSSVGTALIFVRCLTIAGGTSEIVRNQIAERILGLPRDPLID
jgi:alkylation response protein AidB-like acyl-CoA dehydrogenase